MSKPYQPERRTFLQDRFEILIKRQKNGTASFNELTELDEIVNRDPELREKVFREDILMEPPVDLNDPNTLNENLAEPVVRRNFLSLLRDALLKLFDMQYKVIKGRLQERAMLV
jgi:hypothetical protein